MYICNVFAAGICVLANVVRMEHLVSLDVQDQRYIHIYTYIYVYISALSVHGIVVAYCRESWSGGFVFAQLQYT